jgi:hypothetical protein
MSVGVSDDHFVKLTEKEKRKTKIVETTPKGFRFSILLFPFSRIFVLMLKKLLILTSILLAFASCNKYEDGPSVSLLSKKSRLANKWKLETYYLNGQDKTVDYRGLVQSETLEFFKSGSWQYNEVSNWTWAPGYLHGTWTFQDKKESIEMVDDRAGVPSKTWTILRLKSKELWMERQQSADSLVEMHYVPQTRAE